MDVGVSVMILKLRTFGFKSDVRRTFDFKYNVCFKTRRPADVRRTLGLKSDVVNNF